MIYKNLYVHVLFVLFLGTTNMNASHTPLPHQVMKHGNGKHHTFKDWFLAERPGYQPLASGHGPKGGDELVIQNICTDYNITYDRVKYPLHEDIYNAEANRPYYQENCDKNLIETFSPWIDKYQIPYFAIIRAFTEKYPDKAEQTLEKNTKFQMLKQRNLNLDRSSNWRNYQIDNQREIRQVCDAIEYEMAQKNDDKKRYFFSSSTLATLQAEDPC
jgi:hypothetical protein